LKKDDEKIDFYYKENQDFFIVEDFSKDELNNFFKDKKTNSLVNLLDNLKNDDSKNIFKDIEKNTSLIILLKVQKLKEEFEELKNQIMKIEEDEYFFRKYIIVYDAKSEKIIKEIENIEKINDELNNIKLEEFRKCNFKNSKWYLIMQLFIKLPFLKVKVKELKLDNLLENINTEIKNNNLEYLNNFILNKDYLAENEENEDFFDNLEDKILNVENKEIDNFLEKLTK